MKRHSFFFIILLLAMLLVGSPAPPRIAAQSPGPAADPPLTKDTVSTQLGKNQVPRAAMRSGQLYATWKFGLPPASRTAFSQRSELPITTPWPAQESLGGPSDGTYNTSSVAVSPTDGSVHLVWSDFNAGSKGALFYSRQQSGGTWTSPIRVSTGSTFVHYPHLIVDTTGRIWAIWSAENPTGNANVYYRYSADNGATWQPNSDGLLDDENADTPWIAADHSGSVHAVWQRKDGGIYYGAWTGSSWHVEGIPSGGYNAAPSVAVDPSNNVHVAWRRQSGFAAWDIYYATKAIGGPSWNIAKLYGGDNINFIVVIYADDQGTLHLTWQDSPKGGEIWYSNKPVNGSWLSPAVNVSNDGQFNVNPDIVGSSAGGSLRSHIFYQTFYNGDSDVRIEHVLAGTPAPSLGAKPVIQKNSNGIATISNKQVTVSFADVSGGPNKVQLHWDAPPTSADPLLDFTQTMTVTVPDTFGASACESHTLYSLVSSNGTAESSPESDTATFDQSVQAYIRATNPFLAGLPTTYATNDVYVNSTDGAYDGDPGYTRMRQFFLGIYGGADCSGLSNFVVVGGDTGSIANTSYEKRLSLPGSVEPGEKSVGVVVLDKLNNVATQSFTLIYDPANTDTTGTLTNTLGLPVLGSGGAISDVSTANSIIRSLSFTGITVTDNLYGKAEGYPPGRQFWGVWLANGPRNQQTPNPNDPNLKWFPVPVPSHNTPFTVQWNLFNGQNVGPRLDQDGTYIVYARFLDGAGNATTQAISATVTLAPGYSIPKVSLPIVTK